MNSNFVITERVINTIQSLPEAERTPIANALTAELILGKNPAEMLTSFQMVLYILIRNYVKRDNASRVRGGNRTANTVMGVSF